MPTLTSELNRGPRELIRASKRVRYHLTKYVRGIFNPPYRYGAQSRSLRVRGRSGELRCGEYRDHPGPGYGVTGLCPGLIADEYLWPAKGETTSPFIMTNSTLWAEISVSLTP